MKKMLETSKNLSCPDTTVTIVSALNAKSSAQLSALADELSRESAAETDADKQDADAAAIKKYVCKICGYVYESTHLPSDFVCPLCKRGAEDFEEMK